MASERVGDNRTIGETFDDFEKRIQELERHLKSPSLPPLIPITVEDDDERYSARHFQKLLIASQAQVASLAQERDSARARVSGLLADIDRIKGSPKSAGPTDREQNLDRMLGECNTRIIRLETTERALRSQLKELEQEKERLLSDPEIPRHSCRDGHPTIRWGPEFWPGGGCPVCILKRELAKESDRNSEDRAALVKRLTEVDNLLAEEMEKVRWLGIDTSDLHQILNPCSNGHPPILYNRAGFITCPVCLREEKLERLRAVVKAEAEASIDADRPTS